jgi:hypothetical protein
MTCLASSEMKLCVTSDLKFINKVTHWQRKRSTQVLRFAQDDILRVTFCGWHSPDDILWVTFSG